MSRSPVLIRGAGDLATGVAWRLARIGWPIVMTELATPLTVRRTVAFSSAVLDGETTVEGITARRCRGITDAVEVATNGIVAVLVSPELPAVNPAVVVDARLAKINIDTTIDDAPLVVALGPGFEASVDCHAVVETLRGHRLGRVLWTGRAEADTGTPGHVGGKGAERVLRAPATGHPAWNATIGDIVETGDLLGAIASHEIRAPFPGVVRGLISDKVNVSVGLKIGDVDPRCDVAACYQISDKALAVAGGVIEAVLTRRG